MGRGSLRMLSDNFSPNWRQPQSVCQEREGILNEENIQQADQEMPPVFEDQNMKLVLNRNSLGGGANMGRQPRNANNDDTGVAALWATQAGCVCDNNEKGGAGKGGNVEEAGGKCGSGRDEDGARLGLFDCLSHPQACLFSCCCPCLAELYVGCAIGGQKMLASALCAATVFYFSLLALSSFFDAMLLIEEKANKLQLRHDSAAVLVSVGRQEEEERRLNSLVTWSYVTYFMFIALFFVRLALYVVTRHKLRRAAMLHTSWPYADAADNISEKASVGFAGSDVNAELCKGAPDLCAVFWCMPCVLCQHVESVRLYSIQTEGAGKGSFGDVVFTSPLRRENHYEQLHD